MYCSCYKYMRLCSYKSKIFKQVLIPTPIHMYVHTHFCTNNCFRQGSKHSFTQLVHTIRPHKTLSAQSQLPQVPSSRTSTPTPTLMPLQKLQMQSDKQNKSKKCIACVNCVSAVTYLLHQPSSRACNGGALREWCMRE